MSLKTRSKLEINESLKLRIWVRGDTEASTLIVFFSQKFGLKFWKLEHIAEQTETLQDLQIKFVSFLFLTWKLETSLIIFKLGNEV